MIHWLVSHFQGSNCASVSTTGPKEFMCHAPIYGVAVHHGIGSMRACSGYGCMKMEAWANVQLFCTHPLSQLFVSGDRARLIYSPESCQVGSFE